MSKLRYIIDNFQEYKSEIEESSSRIQDKCSIETNLKNYLSECVKIPGSHLGYRATEFYKKKYPFGKDGSYVKTARYFAVRSMSLLSIPRKVRHTIGMETYLDFDVSNCHPTILLHLTNTLGIENNLLKNYISDRDSYIYAFTELGIDKAVVKRVMLSLLNNGPYQLRSLERKVYRILEGKDNIDSKKYTDKLLLIRKFRDEVSSALKSICSSEKYRGFFYHYEIHYESTRIDLENSGEKLKPHNVYGSFCNILFCQYEDRMIQALMRYVQKNKMGNEHVKFVPCFDGVLIDKLTSSNLDLNKITKYVSKSVKIPLFFAEKTMDEGIALPQFDVSQEEVYRAVAKGYDIEGARENAEKIRINLELNRIFILNKKKVEPFADYEEVDTKYCATEWMTRGQYSCAAIKSCLGSGKTHALINHLHTSTLRYDAIFILTPRISYAHGIVKRLVDQRKSHGYDFKMYQDMKGPISHRYVVVQLESLNRISGLLRVLQAGAKKNVLVVLDECVSIFNQLRSFGTHKKYMKNVRCLEEMLKMRGGKIIASDAFLNMPTIGFLSHYFPKINSLTSSMLVVNNRRKQILSDVVIYDKSVGGEVAWRTELKNRLNKGERNHVHCTNKKRIYEKGIVPLKSDNIDDEMKIPLLDFLKDNVLEGNTVREYTRNTSNKVLRTIVSDLEGSNNNIQSWVSTGTISVGVDLSKENHHGARFAHITAVSHNKVRDIVQALFRVRHPTDRTLHLYLDDKRVGKMCSYPLSLYEVQGKSAERKEVFEEYRTIFGLDSLKNIPPRFISLFNELELEGYLSTRGLNETMRFFLSECNFNIREDNVAVLLDSDETVEEKLEEVPVGICYDKIPVISEEREKEIATYKKEERVFPSVEDELAYNKKKMINIIDQDKFEKLTPMERDGYFATFLDLRTRSKIYNHRVLREMMIEGPEVVTRLIDDGLSFNEDGFIEKSKDDTYLVAKNNHSVKLRLVYEIFNGMGLDRKFESGMSVITGDNVQNCLNIKDKDKMERLFDLGSRSGNERKTKMNIRDTLVLVNKVLKSITTLELVKHKVKQLKLEGGKRRRVYTYMLVHTDNGLCEMTKRRGDCEKYRPCTKGSSLNRDGQRAWDRGILDEIYWRRMRDRLLKEEGANPYADDCDDL